MDCTVTKLSNMQFRLDYEKLIKSFISVIKFGACIIYDYIAYVWFVFMGAKKPKYGSTVVELSFNVTPHDVALLLNGRDSLQKWKKWALEKANLSCVWVYFNCQLSTDLIQYKIKKQRDFSMNTLVVIIRCWFTVYL